jgi:glycosyltransferase involved in cell wall biosynthesis
LRILHAIHDFLPRHQAGSEIYAFELARALSPRHDVTVLAAEYDPATPHGTIRWREYERLPVVELVNNWEFDSIHDSYGSARLNAQLDHILDAVQPDVVHVHSLLNLSFDLPALARVRGARSIATLHDFTLVCPAGGQRVHVAEQHVCREIDVKRCARCFPASPLYRQMRASRATRTRARRFGAAIGARLPAVARAVADRLPAAAVTPGDINRRLASARHVFDTIDEFVSPSAALAEEFVRLGLPRERVEVSDYGFAAAPRRRTMSAGSLRIGFVGTLVWHKGVHVLIEAAHTLQGEFGIQVHGDPSTFPDYTARLHELAKGLPIRFCGAFVRARVPEIYGGLDVLVVPSLWPENSPLVVHEAFMHGVAVVAARTGGIPELVRDGETGLLYEPFSTASLARALQSLIDDPALTARFAAAAPPVKTMETDACEWERRYRRLREGCVSTS